MTRQFLDGSVEKAFDPKPLALPHGSGWVVQLTDASLAGQPADPGNYRGMRTALALPDAPVMPIATIQSDNPPLPPVRSPTPLPSSLRFSPATTACQPSSTP